MCMCRKDTVKKEVRRLPCYTCSKFRVAKGVPAPAWALHEAEVSGPMCLEMPCQ